MSDSYTTLFLDKYQVNIKQDQGLSYIWLEIKPPQSDVWTEDTWNTRLRFRSLEKLADFLQVCNGAYHAHKDSLVK